MKLTHFLLVAACLLLAASANAQVVVGTNVEFSPHADGVRYFMQTWWAADRREHSSWEARVEYNGTQIVRVFDVSANATVGIYPTVTLGDVLSERTVGSQFPAFSLTPVDVGSGEFYLGISVLEGDAFGWAKLRPVGGVLTMVENVMAYNTTGIVVGTTQVVPEPSAWVILMAGAAAFFWRRTR